MTAEGIQTIFAAITAIVAVAALVLSIRAKSLTDVVEALTSQTKELIKLNDFREKLFYKSIMPNFIVHRSGHEQRPVGTNIFENTGNFIISLENIGEFCKTFDAKMDEPSSFLIALISVEKNIKRSDRVSMSIKRETIDVNNLTIGNFRIALRFSDRFENDYIQTLTKDKKETRLSRPEKITGPFFRDGPLRLLYASELTCNAFVPYLFLILHNIL